MKTTQRQSLQNNLRNLESKYAEAMRGRMIPSPKAIRIKAEINVSDKKRDRRQYEYNMVCEAINAIDKAKEL